MAGDAQGRAVFGSAGTRLETRSSYMQCFGASEEGDGDEHRKRWTLAGGGRTPSRSRTRLGQLPLDFKLFLLYGNL
jgi:hypothetical protein